MRGKSIVRMIAATFVVVLFLSLTAWSQSKAKKPPVKKAAVSQTGCAKTTDAEIFAAVKEKFEADDALKDQMRHVNIGVKKHRVKLEGWLDGKASVNRAAALAKTVKCVKRVTNSLNDHGGGSCSAGQRPCGDTCIDRRSECVITN